MIIPSPRLIGLALLTGAAFAASATIPALSLMGALVAGLCLIAAFTDVLLRERAFAGLSLNAPAMLRVMLGRETLIPLTIHSDGAKSRTVRIGFALPDGLEAVPEEQLLTVRAGTSQINWAAKPRARGTVRIERCYIECRSPLGLWNVRAVRSLSTEVRIYPNLRNQDSLRALRSGYQDRHVTRQFGRGREFEKLREYAPGDSSDEIHWKASARRGRPVTKVFQLERTQEIYVVLDCSRLSAREHHGEPALEQAIRAALTIGAVTEKHNDLFGVAAFSSNVEVFVRARAGKLQYAQCRDALNHLASSGVSPDFEEIATFLRLQLRRRSLIIFLTSLDDSMLAEHFERAVRLLSGRHLVIAAMIRPPSSDPLFSNESVESAEDVYRALAGHLGWASLRVLHERLARMGVRLALLEGQSFSTGLVSLYDEVKQRQAL